MGLQIILDSAIAGDVSDLPLIAEGLPSLPTKPDHRWNFYSSQVGAKVATLPPTEGVLALSNATTAQQPTVATDAAFKYPVGVMSPAMLAATKEPFPTVFTASVLMRATDVANASNKFFSQVFGVSLRSTSGFKFGSYSVGGNITSAIDVDTAPHVLTIVVNGASSSFWVDGTKVTGTHVADFNALRVGVNASSTASNVSDVSVWLSVLSDAQIQANVSALRSQLLA